MFRGAVFSGHGVQYFQYMYIIVTFSMSLRETLLTANSLRQLLKTRLFAEYQCIQRIRGIAHCALYKFTYLLTYLQLGYDRCCCCLSGFVDDIDSIAPASAAMVCQFSRTYRHPDDSTLHYVSKKGLTLKRYSSKLQRSILMIFGRNIQKSLEQSLHVSVFVQVCFFYQLFVFQIAHRK